MDFAFAALAALLAFISPCVLPMLPVFVTYFTAGESSKRRTLINATGFAIGLIIVLVTIGAIFVAIGAGLGNALIEYRWVINIVSGCIVIFMGLVFIGLIKIPFLTGGGSISVKTDNMRFFSAILFGLVYAISFGPCVISFGSFSLMAAISDAIKYGEIFKGIMLQFTFAASLGLLFIISALLIDYLKGIFNFIKRHYRVFNLVSGIILIILGCLMAFGVIERLSGTLQAASFLLI